MGQAAQPGRDLVPSTSSCGGQHGRGPVYGVDICSRAGSHKHCRFRTRAPPRRFHANPVSRAWCRRLETRMHKERWLALPPQVPEFTGSTLAGRTVWGGRARYHQVLEVRPITERAQGRFGAELIGVAEAVAWVASLRLISVADCSWWRERDEPLRSSQRIRRERSESPSAEA
jgi:hypothetical protein